MIFHPEIAPYIVEIIAGLQDAGYEAYLVGGAVRDFLLKRQPKDYDISTSATPEEVKKIFRKQHVMIIGRRFRLVHYYHGQEIIEISTFRRKPESIQLERKPERLKDAPENMIFRDNEYGTAQEDAERRDFTVNALFYDPVHDKVLDYTGKGLEDVQNGIIRAIGDPKTRFEEDPVRMLRALKLKGQYGFQFDPLTEQALKESISLIQLASDSRMTLELEKILKNPYGHSIIQTFHDYGFLAYFLPDLEKGWKTRRMQQILKLWEIRDSRVQSGLYRESISLVLSIIGWPAAEARIKTYLAERDDFTKAFRMELEELISDLLLPRHPTGRAIGAAVRTILLQPSFLRTEPDFVASLQNHPGYAHARELAMIRNTVFPFMESFETFWPESHREYRSFHRVRKRRHHPKGRPA